MNSKFLGTGVALVTPFKSDLKGVTKATPVPRNLILIFNFI